MPTPHSLSRRKPICHTCGNRMAGHKRINGSPVCPGSLTATQSLISPPLSPPRSLAEPIKRGPGLSEELSFIELPGGGWVRRNPNWTSAPDFQTPKRHASPAYSLVPTVLVDDDGNTVRGSDAGGNCATNILGDQGYHSNGQSEEGFTEFGGSRQPDLVSQIIDYNRSLVTIFRAKEDEISDIQRDAKRRGVHACAIFSPSDRDCISKGARSMSESLNPAQAKSWWVFLGRNPSFVDDMVSNYQQRGMPCVLVKEPVMEGPRLVTFLQLMLASILGGCVVVCGMSFL